MVYTLDFENKVLKEEEILIPIMEEVPHNEALGDMIGIQSAVQSKGLRNELWIMRDYVDAEDGEVIDFLKEHIKDYRAVLGLIRRFTS